MDEDLADVAANILIAAAYSISLVCVVAQAQRGHEAETRHDMDWDCAGVRGRGAASVEFAPLYYSKSAMIPFQSILWNPDMKIDHLGSQSSSR